MKALDITTNTLVSLAFLVSMSGCVDTSYLYINPANEGDNVTYRGGVLIQPGPLAINDHYAFRFMEKWRISHAWLSGPTKIDYCQYNRRDNGRGEDRFFEVGGVLKHESISGLPTDKGRKIVSNPSNFVYGTSPRTGEFKGYLAFCSYGIQDIWTGVSVLIVKPDSSKGTDKWVASASPVMINGLKWLRNVIPVESGRAQVDGAGVTEVWILKIPDTPYWLAMRIGSVTGGSGSAFGTNRNPEKFATVVDLFHQMIASVKLEPLSPLASSEPNSKPIAHPLPR